MNGLTSVVQLGMLKPRSQICNPRSLLAGPDNDTQTFIRPPVALYTGPVAIDYKIRLSHLGIIVHVAFWSRLSI